MDESIRNSATKQNVVPRQIVQERTSKNPQDSNKTTFLSPSEYIKRMKINPETIILENYKKKESASFTVEPKVIVFKNFEPTEDYCATLTIQNTSPNPHHLKLVNLENVSFDVTFKGPILNTWLAAGMTQVYEVHFHPDEKRDYHYDIEFETDGDSFVVPALAVGRRALLSFPDEIDLGRTAVKVARVNLTFMRNLGEVSTGYSVYTDNSCFTVDPAKGILKIGETKQLQVKFVPTKSGFSNARIFVRYDEGDTVQSIVYGEAVECDVRIIRDRIKMEDTYFGLSRIELIEIQNNSEFLLDYEWVKFQNIEEDLKEKEQMLLEMNSEPPTDDESMPPEAQELIKHRIKSNKTELLMDQSFPFVHDDFTINPKKLQVLPRSSAELTVTFQPTKVGRIETHAFLEIGGLKNRIGVSLSGMSLGPALRLNVLSLDIQKVYLCSAYNYEIICENFGPIPGTLMYVKKNADFGSNIRVEPNELNVNIGELKPMNLRFCSDRSGEFVERVDFLIKESSDLLSFVLKGCVICPLQKICENQLDFTTASVGFTSKQKLWIKNQSHAPMQYNFKVSPDGYETTFSHIDFGRALTKPTLSKCPREFFAEPNEGIIEADSCICVEVCYTPNVARSGNTQLLAYPCRSPNSQPLVLPMNFEAKQATFQVVPEEMFIRFCFVNFPYCRTLTIVNTSDSHGYFYIVPQEVSDNDEVLYSLSTYQGHLEPRQCTEIAVTVIVQEIGEHKVNLELFSLGFASPIKCCEISCHGKGPVVSVEPLQLNWGEAQLLMKHTFDLNLTNDSPISAKFTATANKHKNIWTAEPSSGELNANESTTLKITAFLRDTGKFTDRLSITIFNGQTINVGLSAIAVGCCIVFQPDIFPDFNMGYQFSRQDICIPIVVKNEGTKNHHLLLTNVEKPRQAKKAPVEENKSLFKIEPNILEASPGSSQTIHCRIRWNSNEVVEEQWYLHATIEGQAKRELLGTSLFTASFMEPDILFDKSELSFRLDFAHDHEDIQKKDTIVITNRSGRNLTAHLTIDRPFHMIDKCNCCTNYIETLLQNNEPFTVQTYFPYEDSCSEPIPKKFNGYLTIEYDEHKQIDKIPCRAEVNYPHLIFVPEEVKLFCATGKIVEEQVKFVNDTPLPVIYKIEWHREMFSCRSLSSAAASGFEGSDVNYGDKSASMPSVSLCKVVENSFEEAYEGVEEILSSSETFSLDLIDKFLQISPEEGHLLPHSEAYITFTFNGFQKTRISARSMCYIERGQTKILDVQAIADDVKCEVQSEILDFGLGLFCEPSLTELIVYNRCMIPLGWTIDSSSECLTVIDAPIVLAAEAGNIIRMERSATPPGIFNEKMILDVAYLEPFVIDVKWLATIPQVYFEAPRDREFEKYPVDFGYEAVRIVVAEGAMQDDGKFVKSVCLSSSFESEIVREEGDEGEEEYKEFSDFEMTQLNEDGWYIVNRNDNYPSRIDIDMAFERHLVKYHQEKSTPISILAPSYSIDVGFVIVEQTSQISVPLKNYGYEKAKVTLKISAKVRKPSESCFYVELEKNSEICQCESTFLNVTFRPKKKIFTQKRTNASYKFQIEVKNGLTIPVTVRAAAVYPHVAITVENLDFKKVFVGECRRMSFMMKNDGFVDCHWLMTLTNASDTLKKYEEDPFYVQCANDKFVPGQEETLYVYFKPMQNGVLKFSLTITVLNGFESKTIDLIGCGVERKITISRSTIKCPPVIPNVNVTEVSFTVKNSNSCSVEMYWDHLADFSESNRIVRLLKNYYNSYEILIPQRKIGETMPLIFHDFYHQLIRQMCTDPEFKSFVDEWIGLDHSLSDGSMIGSDKTAKAKKDKSMGDLKKSRSKWLVERDELERLIAMVVNTDPDKVEFILDEYICRLKERPNYLEGNDPLHELYEMSDELLSEDDTANAESAKNIIVIFHGPPITEPQETASRTAKILNLPLLNLNQIFLEALASNQSESSKKLTDQLDSRYKELTIKLDKLKAVFSKKNANNATEFLQLSQRIPLKEELDDMNDYDRCELKLEIITSILNFMESNEMFGTPSVKDKASVKSQDPVGKRQSALLSVGRDTYQNVLRESLSSSKFANGFVLQSLSNDFLRNEVTVMRMILEASGPVNMRLFVNLHWQADLDDNVSSNEDLGHMSSEVFLKSMIDYQNGLTKLIETVSNWENGCPEPNKSVKGRRASEATPGNTLVNNSDSFSIWHINTTKSKHVFDTMMHQLKSIVYYFKSEDKLLPYVPESKTFSILREYKTTTKTTDNFSLTLLDENDEDKSLEAHWILQPRTSLKFKVSFQASKSGQYEHEFSFTLLDNPAATFRINVEGIADIPRLDLTPIAIFNAVKDMKFNETHDPCYFIESDIYDFGCLLVLNENKLHKRSTQFKFKNISAVEVCVTFSLMNENYDCFDIYPRRIKIKSGDTAEIEITASALNIGSNSEVLSATIESNDQLIRINLESTGVELQVEIVPKRLNLGRILHGRIEKHPMIIRNHSAVAIHWHLTTDPGISFVPVYGKVKARATSEFELQYYASKVGMDTKFVNISWCLGDDNNDPIAIDNVEIAVEVYEILYDVGLEDSIDLESVPIGTTANKSFILKNLGSYEFEFRILRLQNSMLKRAIEADFQVYPAEGLVLPKKQIDINVCYMPSTELKLQNANLFSLEVIEPYKNIGSVGTFDVKVSVISYFTKFVIEPYPNLNFGTIALSSTKSMQFKIKNVGKFCLIYTISAQPSANQTEAIRRDSMSKKNRKSVQSEKFTVKRLSSMANFNLKCGPFTLDKFKGILESNEVHDITVQCRSDTIGNFEEKLSISVQNSRENREFRLLANVGVAQIDFDDYDTIFAGSHVIARSWDEDFLDEPDAHTVFSIDEKTLNFRKVCVGSEQIANVTLRNISLIDGDVRIEVSGDAYKVDVDKLNIPAMSRRTIPMIFSPKRIDTFTSTLTINLDLPPIFEPQTLSIELIGDAHVPRINIVDPVVDDCGIWTLNFGLSYVCERREKLIQIQNVGEIVANVVVETLDDSDGNCHVRDEDESQLICGCVDEDDNGTRRSIFKIHPCEIQQAKIHFFPVKCGKYENHLRIFVEENPYETFEVNILGEGFCKPVVLEHLELIEPPLSWSLRRPSKQKSQKRLSLSRTSSKVSSNPLTALTYELDYGRCFLGKEYKINFKIINKSTDRYYRFEWSTCSNVTCSPFAGHLMPDSFKEITATFCPHEPTRFSHIPLDCTVHEIILNETAIDSSWDTRQTEVSWMEKNPSLNECCLDENEFYFTKLVKESEEPEYTFVPDTLQLLQLSVNAIADYSDYQCYVRSLNFDDTLMFQTRECNFKLENSGDVNLNFSWELTMDECYPIRLNQSNLPSKCSSELNPINEHERQSRHNPSTPFRKTVQITTPESEKSTSDLFSSSAGMSNRSTDSWIEGDNWPFEIIPETASVAPGEEIECSLKFKPIDVFKYKAYLWCRMENLNPVKETLNIVVSAKSLLPYCHFEIEPSDYLSVRDVQLPVPLGYSLAVSETRDLTKVVEFRMIGIEECHERSLYIINPTSEDYSYRCSRLFINENEEDLEIQCTRETGLAERGKRTMINFTFVPKDMGTYESFWNFEIEKYDLTTLLLIVAKVCQPDVTCKRALLKLPPMKIGEMQTATFEMTNNESCPLKFYVDDNSLHSDGRLQQICVCPMTGVLEPNAIQSFCIEYEASLVGEHNFKILCHVEKLKKPLKIMIMTQVKEVASTVLYVDSEGLEMKVDELSLNSIQLNGLLLNTSNELKFIIFNNGNIAFDYQWKLSESDQDKFTINSSQSEGTIESNSHEISYLAIIAKQKVNICNHDVKLEIKSGPTYRIKLNSETQKPPLEFSFNRYDFGPCYIFERGTSQLNTVDLLITNHQKIPCLVKCHKNESPHLSLNLDELSRAIPANDSARVLITFIPLAESSYEETLRFSSSADGMTQKNVVVQGEGISYKIRLKNPCDSIIDLGNVKLNKSISRKLCIINAGRLPVQLKPITRGNASNYVKISSNAYKDLKSNRELTINITFKSTDRAKSLKADIGFELDSIDNVILTCLKANCIGAEIRLNRSSISFGTIYEGCETEEKVILMNDGDVGSRFCWCVDKNKTEFKIVPMSGFSSPGSQVTFMCSYKPLSCSQMEAILELEEHENLSLNLSGSSRPMPEPQEIINFKTEIKQFNTQEILIDNDSNRRWNLKPKIVGEYFTSAGTISVDPKVTEIYTITYSPKKLTAPDTFDQGRLVIPLPDGRTPIVFNLQGKCIPATISQKMIRTVPCKKKHIENLVVYNNTDRPRTFECTLEQDDKKVDCPISQVQVPANSSKRCKLPMYFDKPGNFFYKVTFQDKEENCQYYEIDYTVTDPEVKNIIELVTFVRTPVFSSLKIGNPSKDEMATFNAICSSQDIVIHGLSTAFKPLAYKNLRIEYLPLSPCEATESLEIVSNVSGSVFYELRLTAKPATPEKKIYVKAFLGSSVYFYLLIKNHSKDTAIFAVENAEVSFSCNESIELDAGDECSLEVNFEPHSLDTIESTITVASSTAGQFIFPIVAQCIPPQPQGPFIVSHETPAKIDFKNVFLETTSFEFIVDNPIFSLETNRININSKESTIIHVNLLDNKSNNMKKCKIETGKLIVINNNNNIKWIYYLRAERQA